AASARPQRCVLHSDRIRAVYIAQFPPPSSTPCLSHTPHAKRGRAEISISARPLCFPMLHPLQTPRLNRLDLRHLDTDAPQQLYPLVAVVIVAVHHTPDTR